MSQRDRPDFHSVNTFVDEALAFIRRHKLEGQQATMGGLAWGALRALAECPNCPGTFRIPLDADWSVLFCGKCQAFWYSADVAAAINRTLAAIQQDGVRLEIVVKK
jgi:hypothetical protein